MTLHDAFTYLLAESRCLAEQADVLRQECEALAHAPFTREASVAYGLKLLAYRGLLANHAAPCAREIEKAGPKGPALLPTYFERPASSFELPTGRTP